MFDDGCQMKQASAVPINNADISKPIVVIGLSIKYVRENWETVKKDRLAANLRSGGV
ncbi:12198_t:CDS:2 [Entrophospora sp. SA101]|nr:6816_t:CDS:2 [Entrophospora sp. SA101]CAJ0644772.1 3063_t:CDS:2 [Entrophospora sp. SA101]CAJ0753720.1 12198_t:CDS:2 [Entrophospora sp. SA101]CAJ0835486.1 11028_t:CDS:2 [Entrophospora sp. SA101]CAJ0845478.1 5596_t:CDS:2 [Entrophospora sp. SA101]